MEQITRQDTRNSDRIQPDKFNIILADPPWRFRNWSMKELAQRGEKWARKNGRSPYPVMTTEDICRFQVIDHAARDTLLFLWTTGPKLEDAFKVINAWGFVYVGFGFNWLKLNPSSVGFKLGLGYHSRCNIEPCLLAKRGRGLRRVDNSVPETIIAPLGEHSEKPPEVRTRIERLYGDVPRLELFARQRAKGWSAWGNEVPGGNDIELRLG